MTNVNDRPSTSNPTQNSIVDIAQRHVHATARVAQDAVLGGVWLYPIWGIVYLFSHPSLIRPLIPTLFKGVLVSLAVIVALFTLTYLPQVAFLALFSGPLAFIAAVPLVLGEAYVIITFLARSFLVLLLRGQNTLVERGRQVTSSGGRTRQLGQVLTKPLSKFSTDNIVRYLLTLPLNLIPVVGTAFFVGIQHGADTSTGFKAGPGYHARYFQLKGYDKEQRQSAVHRRRGGYTALGTVATLLNLIPVVSIVFIFTTTVGAALWAADIEAKGKGSSSGGVSNPLQEADKGEVELPRKVVKDL
ncbi:hypothetical protein TREMEDRAFT_70543 [Tremella mesenterica DSM 1558]|uniref:uncharacterized protein n=1 Tax=Tremella mesenterica (strain ATCC 24925 / CBS 8224 / DSM 1558 / NBRC 9311 / NRRL Y-6157 / RJB 2259-6 / UBC 559-6) TaxID=578456 RepID=UPI00032BCE22|nr:uncharacterized protein TREMEDRAFT_70543 [Tremella mesenterica DSM 1558]EIW65465.1 hypothetical protein TREMEDRAFT_70543 [Tremella mesenterica DSM 1558]